MLDPSQVVIDYTNHRGERGERTIQPETLWFGSNEWHPEDQWMLRAHDREKDARRDFAMKDVHSWSAVRVDGEQDD